MQYKNNVRKYKSPSYKNRLKIKHLASFSDLFPVSKRMQINLYLQTMYVYCVYSAMSKRSIQLPNCQKRAETKSCSNHFSWCLLSYHNTKAGHKKVQFTQVFL